jgi:hypothetical protein
MSSKEANDKNERMNGENDRGMMNNNNVEIFDSIERMNSQCVLVNVRRG